MPPLNESLKKITEGTGLGFIGLAVGMAFAFLGRLLVARIGTEAEYGVFALVLAVLTWCTILSCLGMEGGLPRSIAFARGQKDEEKAHRFIPVSIKLTLLVSSVLCIILFFTSDVIATGIFDNEDIGSHLKVFAFGIPFFTMIHVLTAAFCGYNDVKPQAYFRDILRSLLFPLFLLPLFFLDISFDYVFFMYLASLVVCFVFLLIYTVNRFGSPKKLVDTPINDPVTKELLLFSLPLLVVYALQMIITNTDTLMLGAMRDAVEVGQYNVAYPMSIFIATPLTALIFIFSPVVSELYAQNRMSEIRNNFAIITKWVLAFTFPLFLIIFLYPLTIIDFLFGEGYTAADNVLRILSVGFIINNLLGPNTATITAMGNPRFVMWATLATAILNILLNIALIPRWGMEGAAIASISAMASINLLTTLKLYSMSRTHPFRKNLFKPILVSLGVILAAHFLLVNLFTVVWWMLPLFIIAFYAIYILSTLLTRSVDQEDIAMVQTLEERVGIDATVVKRFLQRFQ